MSERKPVRREGGEKKPRPPRERPATEGRKIPSNQEMPRKKKKKPATGDPSMGEGKRKKPSGNRRPPSRSEEGQVVRKKKKVPARGAASERASQQKRPAAPPKPPSKARKVLSGIWNIVFYALLVILLVGVVIFNFSKDTQKTLFGYRFMTVLTNSMAPNDEFTEYKNGFNSGALVFIKQVDPQTLQKGDIITFNPVVTDNTTYLTHRVVDVMTELDGEEGLFFQTKGDANSGGDIPIKAEQVIGKVFFSIEHVGDIMKFFRENLVVVIIFAVSVFTFCWVLKYYLGMEDQRASTPRKKRVA